MPAWRQKKATLIGVSSDVYTAKTGQMIFAEIEVKNGMKHPWREGASLQSVFSDEVAKFVDNTIIPIDFDVQPDQTFKMQIPIKILSSDTAPKDPLTAVFKFHGGQGKPFGDEIKINIKIENEVQVPQIDEMQLYQNAMELLETQVGDKKNNLDFPEILEILKKFNNNKEQAKQEMRQRRNK